MNDDADARAPKGRFGFPLEDWVAAGIFRSPAEAWEWADEDHHPPEYYPTEWWLRIARLGPDRARRVWDLVAAHWQAWAQARRVRSHEVEDESLASDFAEWASILEAEITELRQLIDADDSIAG